LCLILAVASTDLSLLTDTTAKALFDLLQHTCVKYDVRPWDKLVSQIQVGVHNGFSCPVNISTQRASLEGIPLTIFDLKGNLHIKLNDCHRVLQTCPWTGMHVKYWWNSSTRIHT